MSQFNFNPFPEIHSERLLLRAITFDDVTPIFDIRSNTEVNQYITRNVPKNLEDATDFIKMIIDLVADNKGVFWVITLKETGELIGSIGLRNFEVEDNYAEVGYELHPNHQRKGIMSEALEVVLNFGFTKMNLKTIEAFTHKNNTASKALLEKHNFIFQTERREEGFENNRIFKLSSRVQSRS